MTTNFWVSARAEPPSAKATTTPATAAAFSGIGHPLDDRGHPTCEGGIFYSNWGLPALDATSSMRAVIGPDIAYAVRFPGERQNERKIRRPGARLRGRAETGDIDAADHQAGAAGRGRPGGPRNSAGADPGCRGRSVRHPPLRRLQRPARRLCR